MDVQLINDVSQPLPFAYSPAQLTPPSAGPRDDHPRLGTGLPPTTDRQSATVG